MQVNLLAVNPMGRSELLRFNSLHKRDIVYRTAARLWSHGYAWAEALEWANDVYETASASAR